MRERRAPASRSTVLRLARRLRQVRRGAALLTRKRQALVDELFARARQAVASRTEVDAQARRAWEALWAALGAAGADALTPLGWPTREIEVEMTSAELWGLRVGQLARRPTIVRSLAARGVAVGPGDAAAIDAAQAFELLTELLVDAAAEEHVMRRLGDALARTTRQVNTLERRLAVDLQANLAAAIETLNEREREDHVRIKRLMARTTRGG